jgi:HTH-type transcriptional regulator/antitoxin MqsA
MTHLCPACEQGTLQSRVSDRVIPFEGEPLRVQNLHYSECPVCGEKVVLPAQSKLNEVAYADAKKAKLGLWSCGKIEAFRKKWELTQHAAAALFGGGANAFSKYERGEVIHSKSMDLLMRMFDEVEDVRLLLTEEAKMSLPSVPSWETVVIGAAPKARASAKTLIGSYKSVVAHAANGDRWQDYDVAYGS